MSNEVQETMNLDDLFKNNPDDFALKIHPKAKAIFVEYLNTRPMAQVETFFATMFDIQDQDPFYRVDAVKKLYDYLKNSCPRGEAKNVIMKTLPLIQVFKFEQKSEELGESEQNKE